MDLERYLLATVAALRDDVLPVVPTGVAHDQMVNCLRVLQRIAIAHEFAPQETARLSHDKDIPESIRDAFARTGDERQFSVLAEELSVNRNTLQGMLAASKWLMTEPWCENDEKNRIARTLLVWENERRIKKLASLTTAEQTEQKKQPEQQGKATSTMSGAHLNEATLLAYLRQKLDNPRITIDGYRPLQGGRTRKTVVFRQSGHDAWPEWLVVQCNAPLGYHPFPGVSSQFPVLEYISKIGKINAPKPFLMELDPVPFGSPFMIVERLPGAPPNAGINFFAPPPPSETLALDLARQFGVLHSLSVDPVAKAVPVMIPNEEGWSGDLDVLVSRIETEFRAPSLAISAAFTWMRNNLEHVSNTVSLVHGDALQHNLLVDGDSVSGILDWEGVRIGHPGEDLGYMRPMIDQMVSWDKFMEVYVANGGPKLSPKELDYFTLRAYISISAYAAHSRNEFEAGRSDDIRTAETGCSLLPLFVKCVAESLDKILRREAGG